ncbi:MAG TPA: zinc ribbon domain-containing protein [Blastocatellia bacterium]|nr:zinc ribbon domain-containing protein [Blastocatellia bacterium]
MYCPKCGTETADSAKFCRACGENLKAVSQGIEQRLPAFLIRALDRYIAYRSRRFGGERGLMTAFAGTLFVLLGLLNLIEGGRSRGDEVINLLVGCFYLIVGAWDRVVYKRSLASDAQPQPAEIISAPTTNELDPRGQLPAAPPLSVTEATTRQLDAAVKRAKENS